jgi:hypothetical protein
MSSEDTQTKTDAVNQPYIHQEEPRHNKTQKTISDAIRIFHYFSVEQLIGLCGNIENKNSDFKVRLPEGFKETLTKLEVKYNDEWAAFDQHTDGCTVYYGWIRGNVIGEYKLRLCEDYQTDLISIDCISLTRHGAGGMAISKSKDTQKTDKKAFSSYDWFRLPLKVRDMWVGPWFVNTDKELSYDGFRLPLEGMDKWGPFSVQVVGKVFDTGKMMVGTWDTNHGAYGNYKGTFYGIRLDSVKTASASIADQSLYQTMINFESLKQVGTFRMTGTMQERSGDTGTVEENTSPVYTTKHSNVYHKSNCPELSNEELIEFASSQQARNVGGKPCKNCNP